MNLDDEFELEERTFQENYVTWEEERKREQQIIEEEYRQRVDDDAIQYKSDEIKMKEI